MVANPQDRDRRVIPAEKYEAVINAIVAFLVRARDTYGVTVATISFNESDGGYQIKFNPQDYARFIAEAGPRFKSLGLNTKWLVGDTSNTRAFVRFAEPILADSRARRYLGPASFHSWDAESPDSVFVGVARLAHRYHKAVWCLEAGYDPGLYRVRPPQWATWKNALRIAEVYYKILHFSEASLVDYWQYQSDYPLVSREDIPYPAFYVIKQMSDSLTPGSRLVDATSTSAALLPVAATNGRHHFMIQVVNSSSDPVDVTFDGLPDTSLNLIRSSATENMANLGAQQPLDHRLRLNLPAESFTTLVTRG